MASIRELIKGLELHSETSELLQCHPHILEALFDPLAAAGFTDFVLRGRGSNAVLVSPADNPDIVFRVSTEFNSRRNDVPFFLASPYVHYVQGAGETFKIELLLPGKKVIADEEKSYLLREMEAAGWNTRYINNVDNHFWNDVVVVSLCGQDGQAKHIPIISDPSASTHYLLNAVPRGGPQNMCSSRYITLQDQAAAYGRAIDNDPRLKKLVPKAISFQQTQILPEPST